MKKLILALAFLGLCVNAHAVTPTSTLTPSSTATATPTFTPTSTATPTSSVTVTSTRTITPTSTTTPTSSMTPTLTVTPTLTKTATPRGFAGPQVELMQPNGTPWPTPGANLPMGISTVAGSNVSYANSSTAGKLPVVIFDSGGNQVLELFNSGDALSNFLSAQPVLGYSYGFNGATWDRVRYANTQFFVTGLTDVVATPATVVANAGSNKFRWMGSTMTGSVVGTYLAYDGTITITAGTTSVVGGLINWQFPTNYEGYVSSVSNTAVTVTGPALSTITGAFFGIQGATP